MTADENLTESPISGVTLCGTVANGRKTTQTNTLQLSPYFEAWTEMLLCFLTSSILIIFIVTK